MIFISLLLGFLSALLQISLVPQLKIWGVMPDILLVLIVVLALRVSATSALAAALAGGVVVEIASSGSPGILLGIYTAFALIFSYLRFLGTLPEGIWVVPLVALGAGLVQNGMIGWGNNLLGSIGTVGIIAIKAAIYNSVVSLFIVMGMVFVGEVVLRRWRVRA